MENTTIYNRTVRDFVEDMVSDGKTFTEITTIAMNTHWRSRMDEVKEKARKLMRWLGIKI